MYLCRASSTQAVSDLMELPWVGFEPPTTHWVGLEPPTTHWVGLEPPTTHWVGFEPPTTHWVGFEPPTTHWVGFEPPTTHWVGFEPPTTHFVLGRCSTNCSVQYNSRPSAIFRTKRRYGRPLIGLCRHFGRARARLVSASARRGAARIYVHSCHTHFARGDNAAT